MGIVALALLGCVKFQVIKHDPERAARDAGAVMETLFFDGDYVTAYGMFDAGLQEIVTTEQIGALADQVAASWGPMVDMRVTSYKPVNGQKAMTLFFEATHERGQSYYEVVVSCDSGGYKVYTLNVSATPFPNSSGATRLEGVWIMAR